MGLVPGHPVAFTKRTNRRLQTVTSPVSGFPQRTVAATAGPPPLVAAQAAALPVYHPKSVFDLSYTGGSQNLDVNADGVYYIWEPTARPWAKQGWPLFAPKVAVIFQNGGDFAGVRAAVQAAAGTFTGNGWHVLWTTFDVRVGGVVAALGGCPSSHTSSVANTDNSLLASGATDDLEYPHLRFLSLERYAQFTVSGPDRVGYSTVETPTGVPPAAPAGGWTQIANLALSSTDWYYYRHSSVASQAAAFAAMAALCPSFDGEVVYEGLTYLDPGDPGYADGLAVGAVIATQLGTFSGGLMPVSNGPLVAATTAFLAGLT